MLPQDRRPKTLEFIAAIKRQVKLISGREISLEEIISRVRAYQYEQENAFIERQCKFADEDALFEISEEMVKVLEEDVKPEHIRPKGKGRL